MEDIRDLIGFNVDDGYIEALVRGYKSSLLSSVDYVNLTQCETLEDVRMHLNGTEYSVVLQDEPSPLTASIIAEKCSVKLVSDFQYIRSQRTLHERDIGELLEKCNTLGSFPAMSTLSIVSTPEELYREILVDTPLAPYFAECVSFDDLTETNIEIIRNILYKAYLEDFYQFCCSLGGTTEKIMCEILQFEADRRIINITLNSLGSKLSREARENLYPSIGSLVPEGTLKLSRAEDVQSVNSVLESYDLFRRLLQYSTDSPGKSLEDSFIEYEVQLSKKTFEQQFHYGVFYGFLKLREQEIRNILWICECISQRHRTGIGNYVTIF
ncbi:V-type proton ATPase subunit d 1 [Galdieria sulphuraria]|nr:V-type proton ATPase subunit d 1 [Galdieria sulphuraria]